MDNIYPMIRIEICAESVSGAVAAQNGGADRVELCQGLIEGGTTPSAAAIKLARRALTIHLHVLLRPRGGDFLYTDSEMEVLREDLVIARELGANGIVFGFLTASGEIDRDRTAEIIKLARPLSVTFHRAFDMCKDAVAGLESLIELGVDRVLTSGQEATCVDGIGLIARLQKQAAGRIIVMPGGGINPGNAARIVAATGVSEIHLSAGSLVQSRMQFRNERCSMGGSGRAGEYERKETDEKVVRAVREALASLPLPLQGGEGAK
jgi:copper homeostasis protein